jgi:hypothetical protein
MTSFKILKLGHVLFKRSSEMTIAKVRALSQYGVVTDVRPLQSSAQRLVYGR